MANTQTQPHQPLSESNKNEAEKIRIVDALFGRTHPQTALLQSMAFTSLSLLRVIAEKMFDDNSDSAELKMMDDIFSGDDQSSLPSMKDMSRPAADPVNALSVKYPPHIHTLLLAMMLKFPPAPNNDDEHDEAFETSSHASSEWSQDSTYYLQADDFTAVSGMTHEYTQVTHQTKENECPGFWETIFGSGRSVDTPNTWWEFPSPSLKKQESFDYHMLMNLNSIQVTEGSDAIRGTYDRVEDDLLRYVKRTSDTISHEIRPSLHEGQEVWAMVRFISRNGAGATSRTVLYVADFTGSIPPKYDWVCVRHSDGKPPPPDPELKFVVVL